MRVETDVKRSSWWRLFNLELDMNLTHELDTFLPLEELICKIFVFWVLKVFRFWSMVVGS